MYTKQGFPERNDLVICIIDNASPSSVFVTLEEYGSKEGMIHASEVPRRWLRGIKTYLKPKTKLVCKVMSVNEERGFINLSIRRVGDGQKRAKLKDWENEKKANDILEAYAKQTKQKIDAVYKKIGNNILENYGEIFPVLHEISRGNKEVIKTLKLEKTFTDFIEERVTIQKSELNGLIYMQSKDANGLKVIQDAITKMHDTAKKLKSDFTLTYLGAPKYKFKVSSDDFKVAEQVLKSIETDTIKFLDKHEGIMEVKKQ